MTSSGIGVGLNSTLVHRVQSRISRRLTSPRKFRRAVLCTSRMSRSSAGPCALRLSCVSLRGSVQQGIRELICVHSAARVRSSFLYYCCVFCGVPQPSYRHPLRGSRRWHTLCLFHLPHVSACSATLRIWFYVSVIGGYRSLCFEEFCREDEVQNFLASRSSSELSSHQFSLRAHPDVCAKTRFQSHGSSTTAAQGLLYCVH